MGHGHNETRTTNLFFKDRISQNKKRITQIKIGNKMCSAISSTQHEHCGLSTTYLKMLSGDCCLRIYR